MLSRLLNQTTRVMSKVNGTNRSLSMTLIRKNQTKPEPADLQITDGLDPTSTAEFTKYHEFYMLVNSVKFYGPVIGEVPIIEKPWESDEDDERKMAYNEKYKPKYDPEQLKVHKSIENAMIPESFAYDLGNIWDHYYYLQIRSTDGRLVNCGASYPGFSIKELREHCSIAPYGDLKTMKTIVNSEVRSGLTLDYNRVLITEDQHSKEPKYMTDKFKALLEQAQEQFQDDTLYLEPYNLNVYTEAGFFKPHVDTPRFPNMVGTLVAVLQHAEEGGELIIRHGDEEFVESKDSHVTAFYCDREHEITPVIKGMRIALTFSICKDNAAVQKTEHAITCQRKKPMTIYRNYSELIETIKKSPFKKIGILTELKYTQKGISLHSLKGPDRHVFEALSKEPSFKVDLWPVVLHEYFLCDFAYNSQLTESETKVYRMLTEDLEKIKNSEKSTYTDNIVFFLNKKGLQLVRHHHGPIEYTGNASQPEEEENLYFNGAIIVSQLNKKTNKKKHQ